MNSIEGVYENLRFMVNEVNIQVEQTRRFFSEPNLKAVDKIKSRDKYIDTLKSLIQEKTYEILISSPYLEKNQINMIRSMNIISMNLERIADFSVNMIRQSGHLNDISFFQNFDYEGFFKEILEGLSRIEPAINQREKGLAFRICQCEFNLDELYGDNFKRILIELKSSRETGNLVTVLMMLHYLERMGDSLLNIGEAIIYALIGENLKIQQFKGLSDSLDASGLETPISDVEFESIWGTRSGCRIGRVEEKSGENNARQVLFKHGDYKKLKKEKENIEHWEGLFSGLPPQVCGFVPGSDDDGSILLEYLPGCTFQHLMLAEDDKIMKDALFMIQETLGQAWQMTMRPEPARADFIQQVRSRMEAVYRLHPEFQRQSGSINNLKLLCYNDLIDSMTCLDQELISPFSIFIHGDFNVNNIIYDPSRERIHFIDLHRSAMTDYVQDVSVFLISTYRLPVFELPIRGRLNFVIMDFFEFAKNFALSHNDETFEARLALGLARSLFTSTRFELNRRFAKKMYLLSVYILEKLIAWQGNPWEEFELPGEFLVY